MADLFNRDVRVVAGPLTIAARTTAAATKATLALRFEVSKSQARTPNKCSMTVYNLSETNRTKLQEEGLEVTIEAGYVDEVVQIFKGDIDKTTITRDAVNWITELELLDGGKALKNTRTNVSFRGGQSIGQMLDKSTDSLKGLLGLGNLKEKVAANGNRSQFKELVSGITLSGKADDIVDQIASDAGLKFSVQDKQMQFLGKGEALPGPAVVLDLLSGLLGSPSVGEKGVVSAKSLLNGRIRPGRLVYLASLTVSGDFIADKVKHSGDTWGTNWFTEMELIPV